MTVSGRVPIAAVWPEARRNPGVLGAGERATIDVAWSGLAAAQLVSRLRPDAAAPVIASLFGSAHLEGGLRWWDEITGGARLEPTTVAIGKSSLRCREGMAGGGGTSD